MKMRQFFITIFILVSCSVVAQTKSLRELLLIADNIAITETIEHSFFDDKHQKNLSCCAIRF